MFESIKKGFGNVVGVTLGLVVANWALAKLNAHNADKEEDETKDFAEESN